MKLCTVVDCGRKAQGRGLCHKHYMNSYYHSIGREKILAFNRRYRESHTEEINKKQIAYARTLKGMYNALNSDAKRGGRLVNLTFAEFSVLRTQPCFYCGGKLSETGQSLDRKDNSLGYTTENVVPCCWNCNETKHDKLSFDEMVMLIEYRRSHGAVS
jgi:hypothetical protein